MRSSLKYTIICTIVIWFICSLIANTTNEYICFITGMICTVGMVNFAHKIIKKERENKDNEV